MEKIFLVVLYSIDDSNTIQNSKPLYFTYSDEKGKAEILNIKEEKI